MYALHGTDLLRKRAVTRLTLGAMLATAILAPLILGTCIIAILGSYASVTLEEVVAAALVMIPAAGLGGMAMHRGGKARSEGTLLGWSTLGGALFLSVSVGCAYVTASNIGEHSPTEVLGVGLLITVVGSVVSTPMGFGFGLLFMSALSPVLKRLEHPTQDTPAAASISTAIMLLLASLVAFGAATLIGNAYVSFLEHQGYPEVAAWTCIALFAGPLALGALVSLLIGVIERSTLHRARHAILNGAHPEYHPGDIALGDEAPLTDLDRQSAHKRALAVRAPSAYRDSETLAARIYVGVE